MNRIKTRFLACLCTLALALSLTPVASAAGIQPAVSNNKNKQDYTTWSKPVTSYLYENGSGGLTRVEYINGQVVVEDYDSSFQIQSSRSIQPELSLWGGFFAGETYNFLIYGQTNSNESDSTEVIRVVKYDKDWNRLGQASLNGANTLTPFDAGSLRCDEYNGYLYIRTCHTMYTTSDGLNHQSNLTMAVRQSDMTVTDSYYKVMNANYGYVSHSFNQFLIVDEDGLIVTLDHGDAYPRAVVFMRYYADAGTGKFTSTLYNSRLCSSGSLLEFAGSVGNNTTGGSVGGLAETTDCYIMAYSYDGAGGSGARYPYYHYMDKATGKSWSVQLNYPGCTTPVLAPAGLDGGYMLWNGKSGYTANDTLYYMAYAADGTYSEPRTAAASLSDCQPIYYQGQVVWYTTNNSAPVFYALDGSGVTAHDTAQPETQPEPTPTPTPTPTPAPTPTPTQPSTSASKVLPRQASTISAGYFGTAVIDSDGSLWIWGSNAFGALGNGGEGNTLSEHFSIVCQSVPTKILDDVVSVSCGRYTVAAIKTDGSLWMWGENSCGQLGNGTTDHSAVPIKVMDDVTSVSCGYYSTAAIKTDGSLWTWGGNNWGLIGNGESETYLTESLLQTVPVKVMDDVVSVSCGEFATAAIKTDGTLWMWGENSYGQLGNGGGGNAQSEMGDICQNLPIQVMDHVAAVSCGFRFTAAVKTDGTLWTWGLDLYGELGTGTGESSSVPVKVMDHVAAVSCNGEAAAAVKTDGTLWMWGNNTSGQLGNGVTTPMDHSTVPIKVMDNVACVGRGPYHTAAVQANGTVWVWGGNYDYRLGNGTTKSSSIPIQLSGLTAKLPDGAQTTQSKPTTTPASQTGAAQDGDLKPSADRVKPDSATGSYRSSGSTSIPKLSQAEIVQLLEDNPLTLPETVFDSTPSCSAPYAAGTVKTSVLQAATDRLNALRQIAGLPAVTLDSSLSQNAQYGAVLLAASDFSHTPSQPSGMSSEFYTTAKDATSSSNIYAGRTLISAVDGFMDDSDASNIERVGHRRWQLNPTMGKIGFGYAESTTSQYRSYVTEKVFDKSGDGCDYDFIGWPASGNFPSALFGGNIAWSVTLNPDIFQTPSQSALTVTLTRESDGKTWTFSGSNYTAASAGAYFHVDTSNRGVSNCIIFRPDSISSYDGTYTVSIQGLKTKNGQAVTDFTYQVDFFDVEAESNDNAGTTGSNTSGGKTPTAINTTGVAPSPNGGTAYASSSTITVDGEQVDFQAYALKDANGNETNYLKLRDVAYILNGTDAQFQVGWDDSVVITTGTAYTVNGSEMSTPFSGNRAYEDASAATKVNGTLVQLSAILLKDASGNGYTYYKLRDLGQALGFNVGWSAEKGIYIETDKPYEG